MQQPEISIHPLIGRLQNFHQIQRNSFVALTLKNYLFEKKKVSHITLVDIFLHVHYNKRRKNTPGIPGK